MGWTGGFVLLALLLAPYLRKFGHYTVPDFVGDRFESNAGRVVAVVCALFVSFTYVAGQMRGVGIVFARFLEVDVDLGVIIGMAIVFIYATLGGMKGITWTQVAQYWVLITAFLLPAIAISIQIPGRLVGSAYINGAIAVIVRPIADLGSAGVDARPGNRVIITVQTAEGCVAVSVDLTTNGSRRSVTVVVDAIAELDAARKA